MTSIWRKRVKAKNHLKCLWMFLNDDENAKKGELEVLCFPSSPPLQAFWSV